MKRYIRSDNDYTTDVEVVDTTISDAELEDAYGSDNVVFEFDNFDDFWEWLNNEED